MCSNFCESVGLFNFSSFKDCDTFLEENNSCDTENYDKKKHKYRLKKQCFKFLPLKTVEMSRGLVLHSSYLKEISFI